MQPTPRPTPLRPVVLNQLPLVYFGQASFLGVLGEMYSDVILPNGLWQLDFCQVYKPDEVLGHAGFRRAAPTDGIDDPDPLLTPLDREAMALAREVGAVLLIEGRHARQVARRHGLDSTGTLGLLLQAQALGLIGPVDEWLPPFRKAGLLVSAKTEKIVRALADGSPAGL